MARYDTSLPGFRAQQPLKNGLNDIPKMSVVEPKHLQRSREELPKPACMAPKKPIDDFFPLCRFIIHIL